MRKHLRFLLELLAFILVVSLPVIDMAGCSSGGSDPSTPPPEFVGTWKGGPPGGPTITLTITRTTFSVLADSGGGDTESFAGTTTSFDTSAKHVLMVVATESYTGNAPTTPMVPGDKLYGLYSLSGTTLTMAMNNTTYPVDLSSAYTFTKQ
jgi:hypothetical protein